MFHLESTLQTVQNLILNCGNEIDGSKYAQLKEKVLSQGASILNINQLMRKILGGTIDKNIFKN